MIAIDILERLCTHPVLKFITLDGICTMSHLVSNLKREILQPQAIPNSNPAIAPDFLPGIIGAYMKVKLARKIARLGRAFKIP